MQSKLASALIAAALTASAGFPAMAADLTPQSVSRIDVQPLANGFRTSKIVGASVVNDANQKIGAVDDLLVGRHDQVLYAILSVGGFLGVGDKLVVVPYQNLQSSDTNLVLAGASKDTLKALPEFKYASR